MDVNIKDRKKDVEMLRLAFNMAGLSINYITTDLISRTLKVMKIKKGDFSMLDGSRIAVEHEKYWKDYFKSLTDKKKKHEKKSK